SLGTTFQMGTIALRLTIEYRGYSASCIYNEITIEKSAREQFFTFFYEEKTFAAVSPVIQREAGRSVVAQQIRRSTAHAHAPGISIAVSNGKDPYAFLWWFVHRGALHASIFVAGYRALHAGLREEASCSAAKRRGALREEVRQLSQGWRGYARSRSRCAAPDVEGVDPRRA
ncbi:MAG: hypothetical protein WAN65_14865, partial [Candidatus Sulfotelmatobacter sp.]